MTQFTFNYHLEIHLRHHNYEKIESCLNYGTTNRNGTNQYQVSGLFKICLNSFLTVGLWHCKNLLRKHELIFVQYFHMRSAVTVVKKSTVDLSSCENAKQFKM